MNALNLIDFYKADHRNQYPKGTTLVYSNFTPRSSRIKGVDKVVFFGLQYFLKEYLLYRFDVDFFKRDKQEMVKEYKRRMDTSLGPNAFPLDHVEALHDLGYLPIEIKALPEGALVPLGVPMLTIKNTKPEFFWLTNYIESLMSCVIWKPSTSATIAREYKKVFEKYALETVGNKDFVQWQGHDFSFRGMSGLEDACMSSAGHLISFTGTDTVPAIDFIEKYYVGDSEHELIGGSVPATEHSVMCMGMQDGELRTFERLVTEIYPKGIVSIVSDTWDFWKVISEYLPTLRGVILAREGKVVIRPDSGDPVKIICGDDSAEVGTPEYKGAIECLWEVFGGTETEKGFKLLDSHIGLIYGDSITLDRQSRILEGLKKKGFASFNVVLGIGSFTYQYTTRDIFGFAMKATYGEVGDQCYEIYKDPKTDSNSGVKKKSAKGLLRVDYENKEYVLKECVTKAEEEGGQLKTVFKNGKLEREWSFSQIRSNV